MVYDYSKLRGKIKEVFDKQEVFAKELGVDRSTLSLKLNSKREFTQNEMIKTISLLQLKNTDIPRLFFEEKV